MRDIGASTKEEYILRYGKHEIDADVADAMFVATDAEPGSPAKIEVMAKRFELGWPIFHPEDKTECSVTTPPRKKRNHEIPLLDSSV